jgi:hypothetical protein
MFKKGLVLAVLLLFHGTSVLAFQNEPDNFRGIKWGAAIGTLSNMKLIVEDGDDKFYQRKNDKMKMGEATLDRIFYDFHRGRFYSVEIYFNFQSNFSIIKDTFFRMYGVGYQPNPSIEEYWWFGHDIDIKLKYSERVKMGSVFYIFRLISEEIENNED